MVYNHSENRGAVDVIAADSARTRLDEKDPSSLKMVLYSGVRHEDYKPDPGKVVGYNYGRTYFDSLLYKFRLKGFELDRTDEGLFARHQVTLNQWKLGEALDSLYARSDKNLVKFRNYLRPYTHLDSSFLPGYVPPEQPVEDPKISSTKVDTQLRRVIKKDENLKISENQLQVLNAQTVEQIKAQAQAQGDIKPVPPKQVTSNPFPDTLPTLRWQTAQDSAWSSMDLFPNINRVESLNKALSGARAVKNYVEFTTRKRKEEIKRINRYIYEYQFRISSPLNVIFFMLIGIALGAIIRKGGLGVPALISTLLLVFAYVLNAQGKKFAKDALLDPTLSAWLPAIVFGPLALILIYQAANESRLLDENAWAKMGTRDFWIPKFKSSLDKTLDQMETERLLKEDD